MEGLHDTAGEFRKTEVYAVWEDSLHFYPHPIEVEDKFYALVERHYIMLMDFKPLEGRSGTCI